MAPAYGRIHFSASQAYQLSYCDFGPAYAACRSEIRMGGANTNLRG